MRLGERDIEFRLIDQLYSECREGKGAAVIVSGPVGSGKTALLQATVEQAGRHEGVSFSVTASVTERPHPFGLVRQLMKSMRMAGMPDPLPAEETGTGTDTASQAPFALVQEICRTICGFAEGRRIVIVVDDVHFADEQSLRCLAYLVRRIEWSAVLMVLTESSSHERELTALHAETLHLPYCHRIRLAPLTRDGVAEQLTERMGVERPQEIAELWAETSGGNPLLLHALIDDYSAGASVSGEPEPGPAFREAVLRCLHRSEPGMVAVARAVAVLGASATPWLIGELLGVDASSVHASILDLRAMGLLTAERFRHEEARLAVLADVPLRDLRAMHGRAAELLHGSGAPAVAVADLLMAAHDFARPGASWRVAILHEAAREAMAAGDVVDAVNYLRHASGMVADDRHRAQIIALLADAQWHIDPGKAARYLHHLGQDVRAGLLTGEAALVPVNQLLWRGDFAEADELLRVLESTSTDEHPANDTRWPAAPGAGAIARLWVAFCQPGLPVGVIGGEAGRARDVPLAPSGPISAATFLNSAVSLTYDGVEIEGADQMLHGIRAGSSLTPALFALVQLVRTGRLDEAVRWSDRLLEEPWIRRLPMRRVMFETIKVIAALHRGASAEALDGARAVLDSISPPAWGVVVGIPLSLAVRAATEVGDVRSAMSYLTFPVPTAMFDTPFALPYLQALGRYHLAMGHPETALTHFNSCEELVSKWRLDTPDVADWRNDAAAALNAMGRSQPARALIERQLSGLADRQSGTGGGTDGMPARLTLLREAVQILESSGDGRERARLPAELAAPSDEDAEEHRRGTRIPPRYGHLQTADADQSAYPGRAELTDAERRVAALAAAGATNRQIADKLFITVSTVEQHLTKIYRKLNVRRRSGLSAGLRQNLS
ncbi:AAA family ATPase [Plantactinospora sp. S1510]|uniref:AAA family ATPase n=1 Tax=Plantactinospora alkalitolerans TaxID=2789879 RepID=A0ABS0H7R6_9ACTN|nr:AAA family ATPase [Plantactinospora alkalitolerans]